MQKDVRGKGRNSEGSGCSWGFSHAAVMWCNVGSGGGGVLAAPRWVPAVLPMLLLML